MEGITQGLLDVVQYILGFGATVMLPIVIFILALCFRVKPAKAFRSALVIGIGFVGIFAIFNLMTSSIGPAAQAMVANTGIDLPIVDLGWPPLSAITWASPIAPFTIPLVILINIALLAAGLTRTIDIDLWNYWHFAFAGALVYYATGNFILGMIGAAIAAVVVIKLADWSAPLVDKYCQIPGVSFPTLSAVVFFPIGLLGNWIIDKIPGLNKLEANPQKIQEKFGIFGEPMMIGFILGILLGLLARYDVKNTLSLGINLGAVMYILPRMVRILMDGLLPISEAVKQFMSKRFPGRDDFYIGLDIAVGVGNPAVISTGLLLTPIAVVLAFVIPGNKTLPVADLANLAVFASMIVMACNENIVRALIIGIPCLVGDLLIATAASPLITRLATDVSYDISSTGGQVTAFLDGGNPFRYWLYQCFAGNPIALVLIPVIGGLVWFTYKVTKEKVFGAAKSADAE